MFRTTIELDNIASPSVRGSPGQAPTDLKGQTAERNKTRIKEFFENCYWTCSQGRAVEPDGGVRREVSLFHEFPLGH